jgi:hypothetical protein
MIASSSTLFLSIFGLKNPNNARATKHRMEEIMAR